MLNKVSALLVALACSTTAQAGTVDWGVHQAGEFGVSLVAPGLSFTDIWSFSITGHSVLDSSVTVASNLPPLLSIENGRYFLYSDGADHLPGGGDDLPLSPLAGWPFDGSSGSTQHFANLPADHYYFSVAGDSTGELGGLYTISSAIAPVPEPQVYVLLLAALGCMGFAVRRRNAG